MTRQDIVDECFPQRKKKKRVRDKDIPYMTTTLSKNAIRTKRKAFKKMIENKKIGKINRKIAMRQLGKEELLDGNIGRRRLMTLEKTREIFFQTFKPFLWSSKGVNGSDVNFKVDGKIISNQETVAEILAGHFATIAGLP